LWLRRRFSRLHRAQLRGPRRGPLRRSEARRSKARCSARSRPLCAPPSVLLSGDAFTATTPLKLDETADAPAAGGERDEQAEAAQEAAYLKEAAEQRHASLDADTRAGALPHCLAQLSALDVGFALLYLGLMAVVRAFPFPLTLRCWFACLCAAHRSRFCADRRAVRRAARRAARAADGRRAGGAAL